MSENWWQHHFQLINYIFLLTLLCGKKYNLVFYCFIINKCHQIDRWMGEKYDGIRCCWNPVVERLYLTIILFLSYILLILIVFWTCYILKKWERIGFEWLYCGIPSKYIHWRRVMVFIIVINIIIIM